MRTILQVPVDPKIRQLAEKSALNMGFSSLQESLRVIMRQMANNKFSLNFVGNEPDEYITPRQEAILDKKWAEMKKDIEMGKYFKSSNVNEIMANLTGDRNYIQSKISKNISQKNISPQKTIDKI